MDSLNEDVQIEILSYLNPNEIIFFHDCFPKIIDSLATHPGFVVQCQEIIPQDQVNWFRKHKIRLKLLEHYEQKDYSDYRTILKYSEKWYQNGRLHRDNDLPAVIDEDGTQRWYYYGKLHRENDLPAVILVDGKQEWYQNGELYRKNNLPCIVYPSGKKIWSRNGCFYDFAQYDCLIL